MTDELVDNKLAIREGYSNSFNTTYATLVLILHIFLTICKDKDYYNSELYAVKFFEEVTKYTMIISTSCRILMTAAEFKQVCLFVVRLLVVKSNLVVYFFSLLRCN